VGNKVAKGSIADWIVGLSVRIAGRLLRSVVFTQWVPELSYAQGVTHFCVFVIARSFAPFLQFINAIEWMARRGEGREIHQKTQGKPYLNTLTVLGAIFRATSRK
jgi:hypothetical protein